MPITKQRILQAGAVALALTMLGGYVVYSQMAQRPQQIAQSSKGGLVPGSLGASANKSGTNTTIPDAGMVFLNAAGRPVSTSSVPVVVIPTGNVSKVMMSGSKFATVVPKDAVLWTPPTSPTNPPSRAIMPGSKSFFIRSPVDFQTGAGGTTNAAVLPPPLK